MRLNHLHLHVASAPRAAEFYKRHFGMRELVWHGDILFLRDDAGMDLALAPADEPHAMPPWFHFGFRLADHDAVARLHGQMAAAGVTITAPLRREDDFSFFRCADPDGYGIEVYYEPDPA
jgi:catechol 2,3-dioxygenase-like lactoylglutathione lyase family enzyme